MSFLEQSILGAQAAISSRRFTLGAACLALLPLTACAAAADESSEEVGSAVEALMTPLTPPSWNLPETAFYCSAVWPGGGGSLVEGGDGDINASTCAGLAGASVRRTGMMTNNSWNIAESRCDPSGYWIYETWGGNGAMSLASHDAESAQTSGNCFLQMTIGASLRGVEDVIGPIDYFSSLASAAPIPSPAAYPHAGKSFNAQYFQSHIATLLSVSPPNGYTGPVGYQLSVRAPLTAAKPAPLGAGVVIDVAAGNVVGFKALPAGSTQGMGNPAMDVDRRFDLASVSKTVTAVGVMAAFEEMAENGNPHHVTLESSINPYLQMIWPNGVDKSVQGITFRDLLRHTSPLCSNGRGGGDGYQALKALVAYAPSSSDGVWQPGPSQGQNGKYQYCNNNYALLRILLPLVVEGGAAFRKPDGTLRSDDDIDKLTALSYRNFVRGKVFAPIGLSGVDVFYTGPLPETVYFGADGIAVPDKVNIAPSINGAYDQRPESTVRAAGSGLWFLSAKELSLFIANLWAGNIISTNSVSAMVTPYSLGMSSGSLPGNKMTTWGKEGGGFKGGPLAQWVTFPDGYTAVLLANAPSGAISFREMLEQTYEAAWQ